jgi:hypothetical protein
MSGAIWGPAPNLPGFQGCPYDGPSCLPKLSKANFEMMHATRIKSAVVSLAKNEAPEILLLHIQSYCKWLRQRQICHHKDARLNMAAFCRRHSHPSSQHRQKRSIGTAVMMLSAGRTATNQSGGLHLHPTVRLGMRSGPCTKPLPVTSGPPDRTANTRRRTARRLLLELRMFVDGASLRLPAGIAGPAPSAGLHGSTRALAEWIN